MIWDPKANKVVISRGMFFDEKNSTATYLGRRETDAIKF